MEEINILMIILFKYVLCMTYFIFEYVILVTSRQILHTVPDPHSYNFHNCYTFILHFIRNLEFLRGIITRTIFFLVRTATRCSRIRVSCRLHCAIRSAAKIFYLFCSSNTPLSRENWVLRTLFTLKAVVM